MKSYFAYNPIGLSSDDGDSKCGKITIGNALIYDGSENMDYGECSFYDEDIYGHLPDLDGLDFSIDMFTWILTNPF